MVKFKSLLSWLKNAATNIWRFLLGVLLTIVGFCLLVLIIPIATVFYFCTIKKEKQNIGELLVSNGTFYKYIGIGIDILGNIIGGRFFNWLLLKKPSQFPFGIPGQTISSVIQWNYLIDNLSDWGINLKHDLDTIEFDHCEKSLQHDLKTCTNIIDNYRAIQTRIDTAESTRKFLEKYS